MSNSSILNFVNNLEQVYKYLLLPSICRNAGSITLDDATTQQEPQSFVLKLKKRIFRCIYFFLIVFCVFFASVFFSYNFYFNIFTKNASLLTLLILSMLVSNSLFFVLTLNLFFFETKTTRDLYRQLGAMQVELEQLGNVKLGTKLFFFVVISIHLLETVVAGLMITNAIEWILRDRINLGLMMWNFMQSQLVQGVFAVKTCVLVLTFKKMFTLINVNISKLNSLKNDDESLKRCQIVKKLHADVVKLIQVLNRLHSSPLIGLIMFYQATILYACYCVWNDIGSITNNFGIMSYTSICLVKLFWINFLTHQCKREGLQLAKMEVAKAVAAAKCRNSSLALREELNAFALQLLHSHFEIKGGYYQFGGPFVFAYFSDIFTRTVILVQFRQK